MATPIVVDEEEPLHEDEEQAFEYRDVSIRRDKWVTDEFEIAGLLGRGKFGEVKRCCEISTGKEFAAKFICAPRPPDKKEVEHEINIMKKLRHKRIIQLYDAFECKTEMCLILEIIYGGELFDRVISDDFILTEKACVCFVRQICEGIEYMHSSGIIHLDMKPENILCLSRSGNRVKIIDFGLAREWNPKKDLRVLFGTPEFMAPEVVQYEPITFATDMWSVGVICYVLLSGLSPFMGDTDADTLQNVLEGDYDFDYPEFDDISMDARDLVSNLLLKDKKKRLTAKMCLEHRWLQRKHEPKSPSLELSKRRLKTFVYRRKWQKIVNAIVALKRMGVQIHMLRRSAGASILHPEVMAYLNNAPPTISVQPSTSETPELPNNSLKIQPKEKKGKLKANPIGKLLGRTSDKIKDMMNDKHKDHNGESESEQMNHVDEQEIQMADSRRVSDDVINNKTGPTDVRPPTHVPKELPPTANKAGDKQKSKNKNKDPKGGFFGKKKKTKEQDSTGDSKDEEPIKKKGSGIQRDNSLRRSTKLSKQGPKPEQYVSVEKDLAQLKKASSINDSQQNSPAGANDISSVSTHLANDIQHMTNALASSSLNDTSGTKPRKGSVKGQNVGTFSRVRDRIKFLEQKDPPRTDTIKRRKAKSSSESEISS